MTEPPRPPRILIVEDEALIVLMLQDMLEESGCVVAGRASTCADALAAIDAHDFDAATLDVNLQGESCKAVAAALDARHIPFIVISGYDQQYIPPLFQGRPTVRKPVDIIDLKQALVVSNLLCPEPN